MFPLGTHFEELLKNIRPPQERFDAARDLPPLVRNYLRDHQEFVTLAPHSRLVGSYAQDLSAGDVKDVDFLVRVDGDPSQNKPEAKHLIRNLKNVLDGLPAALGYVGGAGLDIARARRSVHVYFQGHDFHLDVVPCIAPQGFAEVIYVPDRGFNTWIASHPVGYIQLLSTLHNEHGQKIRPLAKLVKHFRNYHMKTRQPKSYWLGALLVHHIRREDGLDISQPLAVLFRDLLDAIYRQYDHLLYVSTSATPNIPDPLLGHNISWNWGRSHFETFMRRLEDGRTWATKALDSPTKAEAIQWWQRVFGEAYFPADVAAAAAALAAAGLPGRSYVTSAGVISPTPPLAGMHTHVQRTTFHGQA